MKKIAKYIIIEAIGPFVAGVLFFTFIFVIQLLPELFKLIINNGAPIKISRSFCLYASFQYSDNDTNVNINGKHNGIFKIIFRQ